MGERVIGHRRQMHIGSKIFNVCEIAPYASRHNLVQGNIVYEEAGLHHKAAADSSADGKIVHVPVCQHDSCNSCEVAIIWQRNWNKQHPPQSG